jgi:hypothetical protein
MGQNSTITTIQLSTTTRDRLYRLKFRSTYDEYLNFLLDLVEKLQSDGARKQREADKMRAMASMTREWAERNVKWKNGRITEIDLDGQ